ncbi:MAG: sodium/proline symporter [Pseudomonadota bacterium]|nr:sodium/proline symporter [Pseudomonadota bacterium]
MPNLPALITLIVYAIVLFGIGLCAAQRAKSQEDFLLGARNLGPWVAGLAYAASSSSAWVLLGFSGFVYAAGPSALWMVPGIIAGYAVVWLWAGPVLQSASRDGGQLTLTEFMSEFATGLSARLIRILASILIAICFSFYVAGQFQGAGIAIDDLFATGFGPGVIIGAAIILAYVFLGGFMAVSLTDTLQGLLMAFVAVLLPLLAFFEAGGVSGISTAMAAAPDAFSSPFGDRAGWAALGFVLGLSATGFGALGQPHLVAWIMASKDAGARVKGAIVAMSWATLVFAGMAVLGLSARAILGGDAAPEGVFFQLADDLLPGILAGIVAAATLSAIMSTVDSQLLVAGGAVSHDLGLGKALGGREVLVSRLAIIGVCVAAVALTFLAPASIFNRILFAWVALGAAFGPVVVARTLGFKPDGSVVLVAMVSGFGLAVVYELGWIGSGPGAMWKTIAPWIGALAAMSVTALIGKTRA